VPAEPARRTAARLPARRAADVAAQEASQAEQRRPGLAGQLVRTSSRAASLAGSAGPGVVSTRLGCLDRTLEWRGLPDGRFHVLSSQSRPRASGRLTLIILEQRSWDIRQEDGHRQVRQTRPARTPDSASPTGLGQPADLRLSAPISAERIANRWQPLPAFGSCHSGRTPTERHCAGPLETADPTRIPCAVTCRDSSR
jgi:hypothetical protein